MPVSSGPPHFHGDTVPSTGGAVIVDLSGMKRVIKVDRRNRFVVIEPGVTFGQLQPELANEGLMLSAPLLPRSNKSVIASLLEREPTLIPRYHYSMHEPLRSLALVWGNGDAFNTGTAGFSVPLLPWGPGQNDWSRFIAAAQGSMGIVTMASLRCKELPQIHKLFFTTSASLDDLLGFAYRVLRFRYGDEFLILSSSNLASILGVEEEADKITALRGELPYWVLVMGIAGRSRLPKERVEFQEKDIAEMAQQFGLSMVSTIPGARVGDVLEALLHPSKEPYWKLGYKGGFQDIFFLTTLDRTPGFTNTMYSIAEALNYSPEEVGTYIQPIHQGTACHCEFTLPYDPENPSEVARIREVFSRASKELINQGAFFSRPYGMWANMVYNRDAQTTITLRKLKEIFDPNNVMNPGKLCF